MKIGSIFHLVRAAEGLSLRRFASMLDMPHATLAGIEEGWITVADTHMDSFRGYIDGTAYSNMYSHFQGIYEKETAIRLCLSAHPELLVCSALAVLRAFFDSPVEVDEESQFQHTIFQAGDIRTGKEKEEEQQVAEFLLYRLLSDDAESKTILLYHILSHTFFMEIRSAKYMGLTERPKKIQKLLSEFQIAGGEYETQSLWQLLDVLEKDLVPDTYSSLDILLLLAEKMEIELLPTLRSCVKIKTQEDRAVLVKTCVKYDYTEAPTEFTSTVEKIECCQTSRDVF